MRPKFLGAAALVAALGVIIPGSALSNANITEHASGVVEFDSRVGKIAPTSIQLSHVKRLKARATWNQYGTPATLTRYGKFLARGIRGKTAPDAARWYLNRHKRLFGLSSLEGLRLESANRLTGSNGYIVNYRQVFGNLEAAEAGLISIAVTGTQRKGWKVGFVSSSLTRDRAVAGTANLSGVQAWLRAANSVGVKRSAANVIKRRAARGWTRLAVGGLGDAQTYRAVAFPTIRNGIAPAYEAIVLKSAQGFGYKMIVDARNGAILARANLVQNLNNGRIKLAAAESYTFSGEVAATDGACDADKPFAIGAGNRALDGFAAATNPLNDLVLELYKDGVLLMHADTLNSPESFHYEPAGGVVAGTYVIRVCDFDNPPAGPGQAGWAEPRTYTGTLTGDASPAPPAYLARWKVFPANPPLHTINGFPWNHPDTDTRETWCWYAAPGCTRLMGGFPLGARGTWDHDHKTNAPTLTTRGNNAKSATSWTDPLLPSPPQFSPVSAGRDYSFAWTNDWNNRQCELGTPTPGAAWDDSAATVNLFVAHNRMHDWAYYLGFTERNFNGQDYNFGLTERRQENDPVVGNVQAGALTATRDNANMITLPDGQSSITNMYFWQPLAGSFYAPCVDGDYDMSVIGHEYGHMIENRMLGKGNVRSGHHAGAMGESSGDQFAVEYLFSNGFAPTSDESGAAAGPYDTGNKLRAIRNYALDLPTSGDVPRPSTQLQVNTLNFSALGYDVTGPTPTSSSQVHANGEIWSRINRTVRDLLASEYDDDFPYDDKDLQYACANGELPVYACPGNRRWMQLYFDAMLMAPTNASMIQSRDAALAADLLRFGGANQRLMWLGYARMGLGAAATATNSGLAETDTDPTPSWESPLAENGSVTFAAETKDGTPITNARFYVGHYEARVAPIADTDPATSGANLDNHALMAPGKYEFLAHAPGYGFFRFRKEIYAGEPTTLVVSFAQNVASANAGAAATGDTSGADAAAQAATLRNLIDDTERTQWETPGNQTGTLSVDGKKVTIDLAGTDPVNVREVQVSAMIRSGQSRFSALRQFEVWACNAARTNCSVDAGFTKVYTSPADAFPGNSPRPVAPNLILRSFDIPNVRATHLRFVVKTNQCTGGPNFQGEQDADPANATDCPSAAGAATKIVRAAEFQAFNARSSVYRQ